MFCLEQGRSNGLQGLIEVGHGLVEEVVKMVVEVRKGEVAGMMVGVVRQEVGQVRVVCRMSYCGIFVSFEVSEPD